MIGGGVGMARRSAVGRVIKGIAEGTGRSDDEVRLALTVAAVGAVVGASLFAALRLLKLLGDLGSNVVGRYKR